MIFGFDNQAYYAEFTSPGRKIGNMREELDTTIRDFSNHSSKIIVSLSSGLDSQVVLNSFATQNLPFQAAFLYLPGYNESEYQNLKILEEKYKFKSWVIDIDANSFKDELLHESTQCNVPPNHLLQRKFLSMLPTDYDFIQGIEGPDVIFKNNEFCYMDAYWSFEHARLRTLRSLPRSGAILNVEKTSEAFVASILLDDIYTAYLQSHAYYMNNDLREADGSKVPQLYFWNYYVKPIMLGKYWGNELCYFPKYQGPEGIDWLVNPSVTQDYTKDAVFVNLLAFKKFLQSPNVLTARVLSK